MSNRSRSWTLLPAVAGLALLAFGISGCEKKSDHTSFASPDEAVTALVAAARKGDASTLRKLFGPGSEEIVFTSGGTESDNFAVKALAWARGRGHLITLVLQERRCREHAPLIIAPGDRDGHVARLALRSVDLPTDGRVRGSELCQLRRQLPGFSAAQDHQLQIELSRQPQRARDIALPIRDGIDRQGTVQGRQQRFQLDQLINHAAAETAHAVAGMCVAFRVRSLAIVCQGSEPARMVARASKQRRDGSVMGVFLRTCIF